MKRESRLGAIAFRHAPYAMAVVSLDVTDATKPKLGEILSCSESLETISGLDLGTLRGSRLARITHPDDAAVLNSSITRLIAASSRPQLRILHPIWGVIWVSIAISIADDLSDEAGESGRIPKDGPEHDPVAIVVLDDVTQVREVQARLARQATHDQLTGFANRQVLSHYLWLALARLEMEPGSVAAIFIDLDGFKEVNDNFGHAAGDAVLIEVSKRIEAAVRAQDIVARLGGDEFAVVCGALEDHSGAEAVAQRIRESLSAPMAVQGRDHLIGASVGIAQTSDSSGTADNLLRQADLAMYQAKAGGRNRVEFFATKLELQARRRTRALDSLRQEIKSGDLKLGLRPVVALGGSTVVGHECTPAMEIEDTGGISRSEVVAAAAQAGLLARLDTLTLNRALIWLADKDADQWLSVTLSAAKLSEVGIAESISQRLAGSDTAAGRLLIQVGAQGVLESGPQTMRNLRQLRKAGVRFVLDNFGTARSPLNSLHRFPVDYLKIDPAFTQGLGQSSLDDSIVASIVTWAHEFGGLVIADGVETPQHVDILTKYDCDFVQGPLLGPASSDRYQA
jgi:diguanylate cyclase (GGDEF)-like protein